MTSEPALSLEDRLAGTVWRILRRSYLRTLGHEPSDAETENLYLEPHWRAMEYDHAAIMEVVRKGFHSGVSHVHTTLHQRPGVDHEMLDEAVEYATLAKLREKA